MGQLGKPRFGGPLGVDSPTTILLGSDLQTLQLDDSATTTSSDVLRLDHFTSGAAAAGYGTGILFRGEDASGETENMGRLQFAWGTATSGAETSNFQVQLRVSGAALATIFQVNSAASTMLTVGSNGLTVGASGSVIMAGTAGTFVGVIATQGLTINASNLLSLNSRASAQVNIDADNNGTTEKFSVGKDGSDSGSTSLFEVHEDSDVVCGAQAALATGATDGFLFIPSCAGAPTGVPTGGFTGKVPLVVDTTNNRLYAYDAGWIAVGGGPVLATSSNETLGVTHHNVLGTGGVSGITITLPAASSCAGKEYRIKKVDSGAGAVTVARAGSDTIEGATSVSLALQWDHVILMSDGTNWAIWSG